MTLACYGAFEIVGVLLLLIGISAKYNINPSVILKKSTGVPNHHVHNASSYTITTHET